jgi:hypothetical protein
MARLDLRLDRVEATFWIGQKDESEHRVSVLNAREL